MIQRRPLGRLWPLALLAAILFLHPASAPVQAAPLDKSSPEYKKAVQLFKAGITDFDGGYYNRAIKKFEEALKLYPSPKIHTRIALCYKWLGNFLKALEHYELFLKQFKPANEAEQGLVKRVRGTEMPRLLGRIIQVKVVMEKPAGAEIRINGRPMGTAPLSRVFRLNPGPVAVSATKKGFYGFKRDATVQQGKSITIVVTLVKIKPKVIKKVITIKATPVYKRWWFWTAIGAVVAGGAAGLGAWLGTREIPREISGTAIRHDSLGLRW